MPRPVVTRRQCRRGGFEHAGSGKRKFARRGFIRDSTRFSYHWHDDNGMDMAGLSLFTVSAALQNLTEFVGNCDNRLLNRFTIL